MMSFLKRMWIAVVLVILDVSVGSTNPTEQVFFQVDPLGTYLFVDPVIDTANSATSVSLDQLGLKPGDFIGFKANGAINPNYDDDPRPDYYKNMVAVFSAADGSFLSPGPKNLVFRPVTPVTTPRGIPTDIPEDFFIPEDFTIAQIPKNATSILFASPDSKYFDNVDQGDDFGVTIYPEPVKFEILDSQRVLIEPSLLNPKDSPTGGLHVAPTNPVGNPLNVSCRSGRHA